MAGDKMEWGHSPLQSAVPYPLSQFTRGPSHSHSAGEPYDVDLLVVKYYCSCVKLWLLDFGF